MNTADTSFLMEWPFLRPLNFVASSWVPAKDGRTFAVMDPSDGSLICNVPDSDGVDAQCAADSAFEAFVRWRTVPAKTRATHLKQWYAIICEHEACLAEIISREQGKPLAEARAEVRYAASYVEWFAEEAVRAYGDVIAPATSGRRMLAHKEPVGVVAAVTPWNFPAAMLTRKVAPALAAGCTVICKPAEDTPLTALAFIRLAEVAGLPPGVLNIVTASRERTPEVVWEWLRDPRVRKISFTGSTPVGKHLAKESAQTLKTLSLELGGNAPFIVFDDADLDAAVEGLMVSKFRNGGQTCVCPNRVFVHESIHDRFVEKLVRRVSSLKVGPASEHDSQIGPMINERSVRKILSHIDDAVRLGATVVAGGTRARVADGPHYIQPTVLVGVTNDMQVANEETFGPVVPVLRFDNEKAVVTAANATPYGLAAYFYSRSPARIARVASELEVGMVGINEGGISSEAAPFGGVKESGYGREGSRYGLEAFLHIKYVCEGQLS
jgi:succinate-semialdehyde dehydrogenase / glutarate-semialdehyde dehydrogenase